MQVRIYQPARNAMQSGNAGSKQWVLQFVSAVKREADPLMGWTSSDNTSQQVTLKFDTKEEAIAYAERNGIPFRLTEPKPRQPVRKTYADNFRFGRRGAWTH